MSRYYQERLLFTQYHSPSELAVVCLLLYCPRLAFEGPHFTFLCDVVGSSRDELGAAHITASCWWQHCSPRSMACSRHNLATPEKTRKSLVFQTAFGIELENAWWPGGRGWSDRPPRQFLLWMVLQTQLPQGGADEGSPTATGLQTSLRNQIHTIQQ